MERYTLSLLFLVITMLPIFLNAGRKTEDDNMDEWNIIKSTIKGVKSHKIHENGKILSAILGNGFSNAQNDNQVLDLRKVKAVSGLLNQEYHGKRTEYLEITVETKNLYGEMAKVHLNYT